MKIYHGSKNKHDTLRLGGGNNEVGTGLYFIADIKVAKGYGKNIVSLDSEDFNIIDFNSDISDELVDKLIENSNDEYWWTNWSENYTEAVREFKKTLVNEFGEDIQTLWYDLYSDDEENFCKIVSDYTDGMYVNQEHGFKDMFVMYNMPKVNELMEHVEIKESKFDRVYKTFLENTDKEFNEKYKKWKKLINMSPSQIQSFLDSDGGKKAGLSKKEAKGSIKRGRDSARAIIRMLKTPKDKWTSNDKDWMNRQISFISRMKGAKGPLRDKDGNPTRKLLALKIWGHNPEKK